jgi:hypothetical protein
MAGMMNSQPLCFWNSTSIDERDGLGRGDPLDDRRVALHPYGAHVGRLEWSPSDRGSCQLVTTDIWFVVAALTIEVNEQRRVAEFGRQRASGVYGW